MLSDGQKIEKLNIVLANPRGFCAGVDRAIAIVETALEQFGAPVYVRHEVVHNKSVVENLRTLGAVFVQTLSEIPPGSIVIFSAHGVSQAVRSEADAASLKCFDATCPLVTKVHMEVVRHSRANRECILIGHAGHPEVEGTLGQYDSLLGGIYLIEHKEQVAALKIQYPENVAFVTQTTLSVDETQEIIDALKKRFPDIIHPKRGDICYATQNRQDAVKLLAAQTDLVLVLGSVNSSNSNRLRELSEKLGTKAYLIDTAWEIQPEWIKGQRSIGITAGASAPETLVQSVVDYLSTHWPCSEPVQLAGIEENMVFPLPAVLRKKILVDTVLTVK